MGGAGGRGLLARLGPLMAVAALACAATDAALTQKRRKTALIEGDILIGALFSVHEFPKQKTASTLTCGKVGTTCTSCGTAGPPDTNSPIFGWVR